MSIRTTTLIVDNTFCVCHICDALLQLFWFLLRSCFAVRMPCRRIGCVFQHLESERTHGHCCNACRRCEAWHTASCTGRGHPVLPPSSISPVVKCKRDGCLFQHSHGLRNHGHCCNACRCGDLVHTNRCTGRGCRVYPWSPRQHEFGVVSPAAGMDASTECHRTGFNGICTITVCTCLRQPLQHGRNSACARWTAHALRQFTYWRKIRRLSQVWQML
jgi:hypothetical protein